MNSFSRRLIILLIGSAALIIGGGMLLDYRLSREEILARVDSESANQLRSVVVDLENWLSGIEGATQFLARVLERQQVDREELRAMLHDVVANNSEIYGATIALNPAWTGDEQGFAPYYYRRDGAIHYADLTSDEADYQSQDWFTQPLASRRPQWSEPYFDRGGGEVDMTTYSVPVLRRTADGESVPYAVVTADVRLADLQQVLRQLHQGPNSYSILFSRGGVIMSAENRDNILRHYNEIKGQAGLGPAWEEIFPRILAGESLSREIPCPETDSRCTLRLAQLQTTGWPIAVIYDQHQLLAPLRAFTLKSVLTSGLTLLLMALAVYIITARQTRPLRALSAAAESVGRGQLDFPLPRTRGSDEFSRLIRAFAAMKRDLQEHIDELARVTATRSRLEGELAAAREIQMSLLPGGGENLHRQGRCTLWAKVEPARTVGGDFYSWRQQGGELWFAVGDVSDKGVPAALFMSRALSLLEQLKESVQSPPEALATLNNLLCRDNPSCMFVTLFLGRIDCQSGVLEYASAGHPAPSLGHGAEVTNLDPSTGPPLGLAPDQQFPANRFALRAGDCLAVFTDGVEEAFDLRGEMFGLERFNLALANCAQLPAREAGLSLFHALTTHAAGAAQSDDITLLLLRYWPAVSCDFAPGDTLVSRVIQWLEPRLEDWSVDAETACEMLLLAEEIVSNVEKYAELGAGQQINLQLIRAGDRLALESRDGGAPFNPLQDGRRAALDQPSHSAEIGGLGVHLIERLSEHREYVREGGCNLLRVEKAVPYAAAPVVSRVEAIISSRTEQGLKMKLTTTVSVDEERSIARVSMDGALNTDTAPEFEHRLQSVIEQRYHLTVLDMKDLDYISSAGLRVIFKAAKQIHAEGNKLAAANRKPHIDKVFEILKALPDMAVFADDAELDTYLSHMQDQVRNDQN